MRDVSHPEKPAPAREPPPVRDTIVLLGRRRAGKTVFLARLYQALYKGATLINGCLPAKGESREGEQRVMRARAKTGPMHAFLYGLANELEKGRWPAATAGNTYVELEVDYRGQSFRVRALDYPGEVFYRAFMEESEFDVEANTLRAEVDRAFAAILLIDPAVVGDDMQKEQDNFPLGQAAKRIRDGLEGTEVPIALVFTKSDVNSALLREHGGARKFAAHEFSQLCDIIEADRVDGRNIFPASALRSVRNSLGKMSPRVDRPPENVVEPLRYCLDLIIDGRERKRQEATRVRKFQAEREVALASKRADNREVWRWFAFAAVITVIFAATIVGAIMYVQQRVR